MTTYPYGYGTGRCSLVELESRYAPKMHPEYARRLFAWIESRGGQMGIGGGWRSTQPAKPGFAPEGKSFHQSQTWKSGRVAYSAVDLVCGVQGAKHRAPTWSEVPKQGSGHADIARYGLHCNVSGEPWHIQWTDETIGGYALDGWQSWVNAGRPEPSTSFQIEGAAPPDVGDPSWPPFDPVNGDYSLYPLNDSKRTLSQTSPQMSGDDVLYLQCVLKNECKVTITPDSWYGSQTVARVRELQGWNGLEQDGRCGPQTWAAVDAYTAK